MPVTIYIYNKKTIFNYKNKESFSLKIYIMMGYLRLADLFQDHFIEFILFGKRLYMVNIYSLQILTVKYCYK
jgi:hypothetical protein